MRLVTERTVHLARMELREERKGWGEGAQSGSWKRSLPGGRLPATELGSIVWRLNVKTPVLSKLRAPTHSRPLPLPTRTYSHLLSRLKLLENCKRAPRSTLKVPK